MNTTLPKFFRLKQKFEAARLEDVGAATRAAIGRLPSSQFILPGMTIAVGAGSRGISNYDIIVRTVCDELKRLGANVFVVPAMGSHGGATGAGQLEVLEHYGITEKLLGTPVRSSMEVVELGQAGPFGIYQDRNAAGADGIVLVNRIKPHTDFHGPIESGLMKMAAIGLGKQKGAHQFHQATVRMGHADALLMIARQVLKLSKILFGIGIVENQLHETVRVEAIASNRMEEQEGILLDEARRLMPRLPFAEIDLLIVDEMGKNFSGSGLDTNVIRRDADGSFIRPGDSGVRRIFVRSLHPYSYGNGVGVGLADFIHSRLLRAMDPKATSINAITALMPANARVPMDFPTDSAALEAAMSTLGYSDPKLAKIVWIKNTLSCETVLASEPYIPESASRKDLLVETAPASLKFDSNGDLASEF